VCGHFQTAYLSLRRMRGCFCAKFQPAEILPIVQQKSAPQAEKRERKKTQSGQLGPPKRPVFKGFWVSNRAHKGINTNPLDFGVLIVRKTKTKGCSYEKKISNRGRRNPAVHTNEQDHVHCRWADSAGRQCLK